MEVTDEDRASFVKYFTYELRQAHNMKQSAVAQGNAKVDLQCMSSFATLLFFFDLDCLLTYAFLIF